MSEIVHNERVSALRVSLPLTTPLSFLPGDGTHREIGVVIIRDATGAPYYGEIAPLPGFSVETVDDALTELDSIAFSIPPLEGVSLALPPVWTLLLRGVHCPSLRCGLEGVILDYLASHGALTNALGKHPQVECNGLIVVGEEDDTHREIMRRTELGFRTLKIKISPQSVESTIRAVRRCDLSPPTRLRFDANRSFTPSEWAELANELTNLPVEYVEEPVTTPGSLSAIIARGTIPIAIDETTRDTAPDEWLRWGVRAVVLKPSINGGLLSLLPLISLIERNGSYVTLSSSFESGVGLRSIALLATLVDKRGAIGVDTASFLRQDLMEPSFPRATPSLEMRELLRMRWAGGER
jgi:O-succinylbenzoate synthase